MKKDIQTFSILGICFRWNGNLQDFCISQLTSDTLQKDCELEYAPRIMQTFMNDTQIIVADGTSLAMTDAMIHCLNTYNLIEQK